MYRCPKCQYQPPTFAPCKCTEGGMAYYAAAAALPVRCTIPETMIGGVNYKPPSEQPETIVMRMSDMRRSSSPSGGRICRDEEVLYDPN